ncbi:uncharacterized protein LOC129954085 isoform X2 [Eupeodes corollae]|uniref:uncharacterized protein LOC129954085 isoform X2 n=1 Tax=Eupeodes corollae TaxID=290404 RepID=UPI002493993C|nr:uncharacterized protein LOC129954085 isoform X2 [Eupeodes corollae]
MGIFAKLKSNSENNHSISPKTSTQDSKIIEKLNMSTKEAARPADEREEGEIIDEFEDIISSDEEFSMRKRIEELEAKNAELEKIANISVSAVYASGGYNDYPKKDSHHLDRYPLVSIDISDDEEYPPAPKMPRISKRRKSIQHSSSSSSRHKLLHSSSHKLLHNSSSNHRRRKRSSSPPPAPSYRQSDKILLSLFHERVVTHNSHSSKRKRKTKKTHSTKASRRKSREYYVSDTEDEYNNLDSYNVDDNHEPLNSSDCDKSYSLNRDELRVALARNTHRIEQHASLKDRLTRKKENTDIFNFVPPVEVEADLGEDVDDSPPKQEAVVVEPAEEEQKEKPKSPPLPVEEEKEESEDNLEEQELRILALKSAVLKKHMVRKKRNENVAYSPSDFDEIYKCISESPTLNNIDGDEACNSMEISPVPSPKMVLSDDGGIDTKPVDMDIVNSDSECELPLCDRWIPIEQIPLPNSIGINEELYNPTPMRYNNNNYIEEVHLMPPGDVRYESSSISPKNFDSEVDEEEIALRALLLSKMNSPKVNKIVKKEPTKVAQVHTPDPDVSLEAETLRNFLINNMKEKAKPKNSSASVLKEAVRRLTGKNTPTEASLQSRYPIKSADETERDLSQAITDMANVNIGIESVYRSEKFESNSGGIRVRNIETLNALPKFEMKLDVQRSVYPEITTYHQEQKHTKENPQVVQHVKIQTTKPDTSLNLVKKEPLSVVQTTPNKVLKRVSSQKFNRDNVLKPFSRNLTVKIERMTLPNIVVNRNFALKPRIGANLIIDRVSEKVDCIGIKAETNERASINENLEVVVEVVDPKICVKIEEESHKSIEEKEHPPESAVKQEKEDEDKSEVQEFTVLDKNAEISNDADSQTVIEISPESNASESKTAEDANEKQHDHPLEEKEQKIILKSEDSSPNEIISTDNKLEIVDSNHMEPKELKNTSTEDVSKESPIMHLSTEDSSEATETVIIQATSCEKELKLHKITESEEISCVEMTSTVDIVHETNVAIKDETVLINSNIEHQLTSIDVKSIPTPSAGAASIENEKETSAGSEVKTIESPSKPVEPSKKILGAQNSQLKTGTKSIQSQIQQKKTLNAKNQKPPVTQNVYKFTNTQRVSEPLAVAGSAKPETPVIKNSLPTQQNKILPSKSTSNVVVALKSNLPNQQLITTRTKIVKPNKIINNQQEIDLKRKNVDSLPQAQAAVPPKKSKTEDASRLITTAEIPKVPELVIQLRVSESESEYSELSAHEMDEDEESRVRNFFNRSITIGNEYYDIASPISLPMESPCDTPTRSGSPVVSSRTQTPQPTVEKSIVNDYFEAKLEQFLKNVRSKVSDSVPTTTTMKTIDLKKKEVAPTVNSTPVAVRHLPEASQQEYRRLINRMKMLERQKQAKNLQVLVKSNDSAVSPDSRPIITGDGDSKFLVRKVLVKNAIAKPSSASVIQKPKIPEKTEATIEKLSNSPSKSTKSPEKPTSSDSADAKAVKSSKENLLVLYESSYRKTGTSIICNLDKSIEMVVVAKKAKMAKLKCEQRLRELRKEMEDVQKNLREQQEKITKIYPEICNSHRAIESLKTRRLKINKAVTALGKSVIGPNYSMQNDQKSIISEKSKTLAAEIKIVNTMKLSDVEKMEDCVNLPDKAKNIIAPVKNSKSSINVEKLPTNKSPSVEHPENLKTSIETQTTVANELPNEELPAHKNDMPTMPPSLSPPPASSSLPPSPRSTIIIENEVPACQSQIQNPEILINKSVPEDIENSINNTTVPELLPSNKDDDQACSPTNNGHEEALELEQPIVVAGDDNNEQSPEQTKNINDETIEEEENGGEQVGSAKLQDYVSPLSHLRDERHINPNGVVCPYQLMGQCDDKDCKYMHLED